MLARLGGSDWECVVFAWRGAGAGRSLDDAAVRSYLCRRARVRPTTVGSYTEGGAPRFPGMHVSISHDADLLAVATSTALPIGVDLCGPVPDAIMRRVMRRWLPTHAQAWSALPAHSREARFQRLWTSTEASAKAAGVPLLPGIGRIAVDEHRAWVRDAGTRLELRHRRLRGAHLAVARDVTSPGGSEARGSGPPG